MSLVKKKKRECGVRPSGRSPYENGRPKIAIKPPGARRKIWNRSSVVVLRRK
jgi:hypothetical protein